MAHRHEGEILEQWRGWRQDPKAQARLMCHSGPFVRGIHATLHVHLAEPDDKLSISLKIDGAPVELRRAYSSIRVHTPSFVGFYADVSNLAPDKEHQLELELPRLAPGQFQGVFFDNVETEFTDVLAAAQ